MMKAQATVSIPIELVPQIADVAKELHVSSNKAIVILVEIGLKSFLKMNRDEKLAASRTE